MASGVAISALVISLLLLFLFIVGVFIYYSNFNQINQDIQDLQSINLSVVTSATTLTPQSSPTLNIDTGDTLYVISGTQPTGFKVVITSAQGLINRPFYITNETGAPFNVTNDPTGVSWGNNITNVIFPMGKSTASFVYDTTIVVYFLILGNGVTTS